MRDAPSRLGETPAPAPRGGARVEVGVAMRRGSQITIPIGGRRALPVAVALALLVGADGPAAGQGGEVKVVEIEVGDNMRFTPSAIEARPGERLRVILRAVGKIQALRHNFVLLKSGTSPKAFVDRASAAIKDTGEIPAEMKDQVIAASALVKSGGTAEVVLEAPTKTGEYIFVCGFRGHFNLGMKRRLIVQ